MAGRCDAFIFKRGEQLFKETGGFIWIQVSGFPIICGDFFYLFDPEEPVRFCRLAEKLLDL
jgi:hypothetical protein